MTNRRMIGNPPVLTTERLSLRRHRDSDTDAIVNVVGDWEVARRLARVPYPYSRSDARFFLEEVVPVEWVWAITLRDNDMMVGTIGFTPDDDPAVAELGYWLSASLWGRGVTTEAARAVVAFAFTELRLAKLTSGYFVDNPASGAVLRKLNFVEVGHVVRPCLATQRAMPSIRAELAQRVTGEVADVEDVE